MKMLFSILAGLILGEATHAADLKPLVRALMDSESELSDAPFAEVVRAGNVKPD